MTLTMTKFNENLLFVFIFYGKFYSSLEIKMVLKIPNEIFLRIIQYEMDEQTNVSPFTLAPDKLGYILPV